MSDIKEEKLDMGSDVSCDDLNIESNNIKSIENYNNQNDLVIIPTNYKDNNYNKKFKHRIFNKLAITACIVTIFGGLSIGIGIGISLPITQMLLSSRSSHNQFIHNMDHSDMVFSSTIRPLSMVDAVNKVKPSVVSINTTSSLFGSRGIGSLPSQFDFNLPSSGTGIIFDKDDEKVYIVTNEHVIGNASNINISINRSEEVPASVLGTDIQSDLAVIYVLKSDLKEVGINEVVVAEFGYSSEMQVGEVVIAIGNALGQGNTTTMGIVSALNIQIPIDGRLLTVLQTDAAINPGNSGGPLINLKGEVIGINTVKLAKDNVYGMGYSITSDVAIPIMKDLRNQTPRPYLGIRGHDVTDNIASMFNLEPKGVFVHSVYIGSGAYNAGLRSTDIITHFNNRYVLDMSTLSSLIREQEVGDKVELRIIRDGNTTLTLNVLLTTF